MAISPQLLKKIILEQRDIPLPSELFERGILSELRPLQKSNDIVVITGLRRCGKSTVLHHLRQSKRKADYALNFDDERLEPFQLSDFQTLCEVFIELFGVQNEYYFDEIQNIPGWERFVRRLHTQGHKVYVTGSNATLFSQELGTRLTGRYTQVEMYPYSFKEYASHYLPNLKQLDIFTTEQVGRALGCFSDYLEKGGLPEYIRFGEKSHLQMLYESILYRDIVARYHLTSDVGIKKLVLLLASHVGKELSYASLAKTLGLSATSVADYCSYLQGSNLSFLISRYSHSVNKQILSHKKCYFIDPSMARIVGFRPSEDRGRLFENLIFLELKRRKEEIYFHKEEKECDFITRKAGRIHQAIQVCADISSPETKRREIEGLLDAMRAHSLKKGLIITDHEEETLKLPAGTLTLIPAWKWLLGD
jgi:hypothetical protein